MTITNLPHTFDENSEKALSIRFHSQNHFQFHQKKSHTIFNFQSSYFALFVLKIGKLHGILIHANRQKKLDLSFTAETQLLREKKRKKFQSSTLEAPNSRSEINEKSRQMFLLYGESWLCPLIGGGVCELNIYLASHQFASIVCDGV
jgi:hypothetical protein